MPLQTWNFQDDHVEKKNFQTNKSFFRYLSLVSTQKEYTCQTGIFEFFSTDQLQTKFSLIGNTGMYNFEEEKETQQNVTETDTSERL